MVAIFPLPGFIAESFVVGSKSQTAYKEREMSEVDIFHQMFPSTFFQVKVPGSWGSQVRIKHTITGWWQLKYLFIFTPKIGEDEPILTNICQMGWFNHQPALFSSCAERNMEI